MTPATKHNLSDISTNSSVNSSSEEVEYPSKKVKASPSTESPKSPKSTGIASGKASKPTFKTPTGKPKHQLIPVEEERRSAKKGDKDESLLRVLCVKEGTDEEKELFFKNIVHSRIDWDNPDHIGKINSWRNQIYGRAGQKMKDVTMWHPDEALFCELYFNMLIAKGRKTAIEVPKGIRMFEDFNGYFVNRILKDKDGNDLPPRTRRNHSSISSKMTRVCEQLKPRLDEVMKDKEDAYIRESYRPKITGPMLAEFCEFKVELGLEDREACDPELEKWMMEFIEMEGASDMQCVIENKVVIEKKNIVKKEAAIKKETVIKKENVDEKKGVIANKGVGKNDNTTHGFTIFVDEGEESKDASDIPEDNGPGDDGSGDWSSESESDDNKENIAPPDHVEVMARNATNMDASMARVEQAIAARDLSDTVNRPLIEIPLVPGETSRQNFAILGANHHHVDD
ncbi:hypothetical protein CC78DRAFT_547391 [Lojkania enalia]|uniref:Uncharacterized protein n=1 Tax=Lojkania enalia TaxID=147567 RepID=A0A9P4MWU0_9PLEO|nr:hypothetical protein CC78DRAFT_547391 [Didymosphaeria enalia]